MAATRIPGDVQLLTRTLETYLTHDAGLGDLSSWVLEDLGPGAHFIDTDTDAIWAFILLCATTYSAIEEPFPSLRIGPNTFAMRDRIRTALDDVGERDDISSAFRLRQFESRVLPAIRASFESAFGAFETIARDKLAAAAIDERAVERLREALVSAWQGGFPRRILVKVGSVRASDAVGDARSRFGLSATAPKAFFLRDEAILPDSPDRIGHDLGEAIARGEGSQLAGQLANLKVTNYPGSLENRIQRAMTRMGRLNTPATHCLLPLSWKLRDALGNVKGVQHLADADGEIWLHRGVSYHEWFEWRDPTMLFLSLPRAVTVTQYENHARHSVRVGFDVLDPAPDQQEPLVRIQAYERLRLRLTRRYILRVALPPALND